MQCAHQQLVRDSPELCHGQEAISAWHSWENLRNLVKPFRIRGAGAPSDDALRETEATRRWNDRQASRWLGNAEKTQPTGWVQPKDEPGRSLKIHRWCEEWWASNNASNALHTTINRCTNTRGVEAQVKRVSFVETSFEIWIIQEQLWQF